MKRRRRKTGSKLITRAGKRRGWTGHELKVGRLQWTPDKEKDRGKKGSSRNKKLPSNWCKNNLGEAFLSNALPACFHVYNLFLGEKNEAEYTVQHIQTSGPVCPISRRHLCSAPPISLNRFPICRPPLFPSFLPSSLFFRSPVCRQGEKEKHSRRGKKAIFFLSILFFLKVQLPVIF